MKSALHAACTVLLVLSVACTLSLGKPIKGKDGWTPTQGSGIDRKDTPHKNVAGTAGLYIWRDSFELSDHKQVLGLVECLKATVSNRPKITRVLLNIFREGRTTYTPFELGRAVALLHKEGIEVYALMTSRAVEKVKWYHGQTKKKDEHFDGVALNFEDLKPGSSPAHADVVYNVFHLTAQDTRALNLKFHVSIGHWYEHAQKNFFTRLMNIADSVDIQAYNNRPKYARAAVEPELKYFKDMGKNAPQAYIGVETQDNKAPNENWARFGEQKMWAYVKNEFKGMPDHGIMIHYFNNMFCKGEGKWPRK